MSNIITSKYKIWKMVRNIIIIIIMAEMQLFNVAGYHYLIKLGPAVWPKLQPAEARECSAALAISEWTRRLSAMLIIARRKMLF